jgi:hypothetical protein
VLPVQPVKVPSATGGDSSYKDTGAVRGPTPPQLFDSGTYTTPTPASGGGGLGAVPNPPRPGYTLPPDEEHGLGGIPGSRPEATIGYPVQAPPKPWRSTSGEQRTNTPYVVPPLPWKLDDFIARNPQMVRDMTMKLVSAAKDMKGPFWDRVRSDAEGVAASLLSRHLFAQNVVAEGGANPNPYLTEHPLSRWNEWQRRGYNG